MAENWGVHFNQHWVSKELNPFQNYDRDQALMYPLLAKAGGTVARYHGLWSDYQTQPAITFNANAFQLSDTDYAQYLHDRGFGKDGALLALPFQSLKIGQQNKIHTLFNVGGIPEWAQTGPGTLVLRDNAHFAEFLSDFIVYAARQPDGIDVLSSVTGIQIFNEVNGGMRPYEPGYGYRNDQLPHQQYFEIVDHALHQVQQSYAAIGLATKTTASPPPIVAPNLGGAYIPGFWDALVDYAPQHETSRNSAGHLALNAVALHPYGVSVRPDVDPVLSDTSPMPNVDSWALRETLTYHRYMMPTDDRVWMETLVSRNPELSAQWQLAMYGPRGNSADEYFDRNTELGVERSMVKLTQLGYADVKIHFSEFGASSFVGGGGAESLWDTVFADPYKYGFIPMNGTLTKAVAENLQAESVMQTVGLIASWDFVETATAYQFFDYEGAGSEKLFGLARQKINGDGTPEFKPAGQAYAAFIQGDEIHLRNLSGKKGNIGVDIHVAAANGKFNGAKRDPSAHELVVLRNGADTLEAGDGDDVVFGGPGADRLEGGKGFDKLYGGPGNDLISGGPGNDRIKGDSGDDVMSGGLGSNHFVFVAHAFGESGKSGHDVISDFKPASKGGDHDQITIVGGYGAKALFGESANPLLVQDTVQGVVIHFADNGASLLLNNVTKAQLNPTDFHVLDADVTIDFSPDLVAPF